MLYENSQNNNKPRKRRISKQTAVRGVSEKSDTPAERGKGSSW